MPLTSRSQDFWCSHLTFWEVRKALPSWTLCSQGLSENLLWVSAQLSLSALRGVSSHPGTECAADLVVSVLLNRRGGGPGLPPTPAGCICSAAAPVEWHWQGARWSPPRDAGSSRAGWATKALSSSPPHRVARTCS